MSSKSDNHGHGPLSRRPPGNDIDVDDLEVTNKLLYKIMTLDKSMFDVNEDDIKQHFPFDPSSYPDNDHGSMYMFPPSSPLYRIKTHNWKHQKKKSRQNSCCTKPNKLGLILPLPNCYLNSIHHLSKYDQ